MLFLSLHNIYNVIMENLDLILSGAGMGAMVVKSLLFLLLDPKDLFADDYVKKQIEKYMNQHKDVKNVEEVSKFVTLVLNDKFTEETLNRKENRLHLFELNSLKDEMLNFYFTELNQIEDPQVTKVCDIQTSFDRMYLRLVRLRMVIQPEIQISHFVHPSSDISYLAAKSFWIYDDGNIKRDITRSLGALEDFGYDKYEPKIVKVDPKVLEEGLKRIQEVVTARYKEVYLE